MTYEKEVCLTLSLGMVVLAICAIIMHGKAEELREKVYQLQREVNVLRLKQHDKNI